MLPIGTNAEPGGPIEIVLTPTTEACVVHADIEEVDARLILVIEAAHVGLRAVGLDHDGDAVKLVMPGMKDVTHDQTVAPQYLSKAAVRFAAMSCGDRPSI